MVKTRNHNREQYTEERYNHGEIFAWKNTWEEYDEEKDKWNKKSQIVCQLKREKLLNLGECNDGTPFSAVSQAVNVAKGLCNYKDEKEIEQKLRSVGFKNEDFLKYNSLKDLERIKVKKGLYEQHIQNR